MRLDCYQVQHVVPEMVPGGVRRGWMDDVPDRHAYRCLPLNMANSTGWELRLAYGFDAEWNGDPANDAIKVTPHEPSAPIAHIASSHFGSGILTFHTGWLFRTPQGWNVWAMGLPNQVKDLIQPLSGLVQTDWLPYPFTMNWKFTRPGAVSFEKGEPFCFITLVRPQAIERITPKLMPIERNPELKAEYEQWREARSQFNTLMAAGDAEAIRQAWQRFYMRGIKPDGREAPVEHANRRRLHDPEKG